MDVWAPAARHFRSVTNITNVIGTVAVDGTIGGFVATGNSTDAAGYATPGDQQLNSYGEAVVRTFSAVGSKLGFLFRYTDSSNYYAASLTTTGATVDSVVGGVSTNILTVSFTIGAFAVGSLPTFRAEMLDDTVTLYYRGAIAGSVQNTSLTAPGFTCLYLRGQTTATNSLVYQFETGPFWGGYAPPLNQQPGPARRLR